MERMPPERMARARADTTTPVRRAGAPKARSRAAAMELDWVMSPMPKEASRVERAKIPPSSAPSHRGRMARRMTYMGPPHISPRLLRWRYFTASRHSAHLLERPRAAESSIHTRAPGPPEARAVATPTMLPVPMVAASVVIRAEKGETSPVPRAERASRLNTILRAWGRFRQGRKRVRMSRKRPVPVRRTRVPGPHSRRLAA